MIAYEFNVPLSKVPFEPYWIDDNLVLFSTDIPLPKSDYWGPTEATRLLVFDIKPELVKKKITDLIIVLNFLNREFNFMQWIFDKALTEKHLDRYAIEIEDIKAYVEGEYVKPKREPDWFYIVDYSKYPLYEIQYKPTRADVGECFRNYSGLSLDDPLQKRIKELFDFFSFSNLSQMVMYKVYDNSNLRVSNSFVVLESLVLLEIKDQSIVNVCPSCGIETKGGRPTMEMVAEFLSNRIKEKKTMGLIMQILKKHYRTRNRFLHAAKFDRSTDLIDKMIKKTGSNHIKLEDEIEHAGASDMGLNAINAYLRIEFLDRIGCKEIG